VQPAPNIVNNDNLKLTELEKKILALTTIVSTHVINTNKHVENYNIVFSARGYSQKNIQLGGVVRPASKSAIFPYPIYDQNKNWIYTIYDRCGWNSCPKHNLWRAFVHGLIDNDEKVASSKKAYQIQD